MKRDLVLLLLTDAVFLFAVWLIRPEAMGAMGVFFGLFTLLILAVGAWLDRRERNRKEQEILRFLQNPEETPAPDSPLAPALLRERALRKEKALELEDYREYIESWVHEVKTPLSLAVLVLNNHAEELSPYVRARLEYAHHQLGEDVERILYYARLQTDHPDVTFRPFPLHDCVTEVAGEYKAIMEERNIHFSEELERVSVVSDRKIVTFLLNQLFSNAVKYGEREIAATLRREGDKAVLHLRNDGPGAVPEDVPFLFDKGFTGSYPNRQKATGMGLYLVRKYARMLCVDVSLDGPGPGFGIRLTFCL